jgi:hypothetical protein
MKKYNGPPKPIPTHRELISDKVERIIFLLLAIFFAVLLLLGVI